jgi:hypothetical protein
VFDVDERVHDPEELFTTYGHRSPKRRNRQCKWVKMADLGDVDDVDDPAVAGWTTSFLAGDLPY